MTKLPGKGAMGLRNFIAAMSDDEKSEVMDCFLDNIQRSRALNGEPLRRALEQLPPGDSQLRAVVLECAASYWWEGILDGFAAIPGFDEDSPQLAAGGEPVEEQVRRLLASLDEEPDRGCG